MAPTAFEPQPLSVPLNDHALATIGDLIRNKERDKKLRERLREAAQYLTDVTGDLNDKAFERRLRNSKEKARRQAAAADGNQDVGEDDEAAAEADRAHEEFQGRVDTLTKKMDLSIRAIIDDQTWVDEIPDILSQVIDKAQETTQTQRTAYGVSPTPLPRTQTQQRSGSESGDNDDDNERAPSRNDAPTPAAFHPSDTPHVQLAAILEKQTRSWAAQSLTEKYSHHNDYRHWYRVLYDAKNPGDSAPPMPDEGLWFAAEEGRDGLVSTQSQRRKRQPPNANDRSMTETGTSSESEADLVIAQEKTRLICPITLLPFVEPVTSKNCNHSYEKPAILSMLKTSTNFLPFTSEQLMELSQLTNRERPRREKEMHIPQVSCPECDVKLVETDLVENPVLKRRVARSLAKEKRKAGGGGPTTSDIEADEDDANVDDVDDSDNDAVVVGGGTSAAARRRRRTRNDIKAERMSGIGVIPQTQLSGTNDQPTASGTQSGRRGRATRILDLEDDD